MVPSFPSFWVCSAECRDCWRQFECLGSSPRVLLVVREGVCWHNEPTSCIVRRLCRLRPSSCLRPSSLVRTDGWCLCEDPISYWVTRNKSS
jgi:hypothetical protein